ncbi:MAG TPA: hypothetical protein ENL23_01290 [Candidatus Acetothermia bacterium]|nr:hypothetical protein [Candidatus Acetothermia bacterium]
MDSKKFGGGASLPHPTSGKKLLLFAGMLLTPSVVSMAQTAADSAKRISAQEIVDQILAFIYSLGHLIGQGVVKLVVAILPSMQFPTDLVDPIGLLAILTIFLAVAAVAKKLVWIVVIAGWALILVRLILVIVQNYV